MMASSNSGIQEATTNGGNRYIRNITSGVWSRWVLQLNDNAPTWTNLTLQNGAVQYSTSYTPGYTKIGSVVYIRGAVKGVAAVGTTIATLPVGFRPTMTESWGPPTTGTGQARWSISSTGAIVLEQISSGTPTSADWFPLSFSFVIA
jgi:hypothetical protein